MYFLRLLTAALLLVVLSLFGCGPQIPPKHPQDGKTARETMRLDPIHVKATDPDGDGGEEPKVEAYDASRLFKKAAKNLREGNCEEAVNLYGKLVQEFETSDLAPLSLYNSGLCYEQLKQYDNAAADYLALIEKFPKSRDVTDAMFRLAGAHEKLESWSDASQVLYIILNDREDLEGIERVEALSRNGSALINVGKHGEAKLSLDEAVAIFRTGYGLPPSSSTFYHGMARFKLGEIVEHEMRATQIPADEAIVEAALEHKCELLLKAQREYTQAIKVGHPHWAAAAAYRIGHLYRGLWDDMVSAPAPEDLDAEAQEIYAEVLKDRIRVLLSKAVVQWERTLKMARRLNLDNEWVDQTTEELEEIRETLALVEEKPGEE